MKEIIEFIRLNPEMTAEEIQEVYPNEDPKVIEFHYQQHLVRTKKTTSAEAGKVINPGKAAEQADKEPSVQEKVFRFLAEKPDAKNKAVYLLLPKVQQNTLRKAIKRYNDFLLPIMNYIKENPKATGQQIVEEGLAEKTPKKHLRLAHELNELRANPKPKTDKQPGQQEKSTDEPKTEKQAGADPEQPAKNKKAAEAPQVENLDKIDLLIELQKETNQKLDQLIDLQKGAGDISAAGGADMETMLKAMVVKLMSNMIK